MTTPPDDRPASRADATAELVAEMRAAVEEATRQIEELTTALGDSQVLVDDLESVVDILLDLAPCSVVVIDDSRRITGLSAGAGAQLEGAAVGKPLSSVLPDVAADTAVDALDHGARAAVELATGGKGARVHPLPGGGAVLVLPNR